MKQSDSHAERVAALKSRKAELAQELSEEQSRLARAAGEARERHDTAVAEAEREAEEHTSRLEAEIARTVVDEIFPLARAFGDTPRATATRFAETWRRLNARALDELGAPLHSDFIAFAFAAPDGLADRLTNGLGHMSVGSAAHFVARSCVENTTPPLLAVLENQLRQVEVTALECARQIPHGDPARLEVLLSRATGRAKTIAVDAFEEERQAAKREQERIALAPIVEKQRQRAEKLRIGTRR